MPFNPSGVKVLIFLGPKVKSRAERKTGQGANTGFLANPFAHFINVFVGTKLVTGEHERGSENGVVLVERVHEGFGFLGHINGAHGYSLEDFLDVAQLLGRIDFNFNLAAGLLVDQFGELLGTLVQHAAGSRYVSQFQNDLI